MLDGFNNIGNINKGEIMIEDMDLRAYKALVEQLDSEIVECYTREEARCEVHDTAMDFINSCDSMEGYIGFIKGCGKQDNKALESEIQHINEYYLSD